MFWGLIMEPNRYYSQKVKVSFHVSMAALDIANSSDNPTQVMCVFEGRNYLLCTLNTKDKVQCPLDLNFEAGSEVTFATNGKAYVHLTGYLINEEDVFLNEGEEVEEEEEEDVVQTEKKRLKKEQPDGPPNKKSKTAPLNTKEEVEEEESSDSDFDVNQLIEDEDDGEEEEVEEEEDEEDGDSEAVEEEEDSSLSEEEAEESEEEKPNAKPKQNGVSKTSSTPLPKKKGQKQEDVPKEKKQEEVKGKKLPQPKKTVLKGGVLVQDLKEGSGEIVKNGKFVHVYYEGRLKDNNKMFDATTKGPGFRFRVGKGEVIKGWDIGLVGMKVGGQRRITCPPNVAYGVKGSPPVIPPNSTLVFDVTVKKIS